MTQLPCLSLLQKRVKSSNLPRGHAFVKVGSDIAEIETLPTPKRAKATEVAARKERIIEQTRKKYCRPALEVEEEIQQRLELVQPSQEVSETETETTPKKSEEKQDWQPFDEV